MKKIYLLVISLVAAVMLCSCGPHTTTATLHIDEDLIVTKVVLAKMTGGITCEVVEEYENLNLKKGDSLTCPVSCNKR